MINLNNTRCIRAGRRFRLLRVAPLVGLTLLLNACALTAPFLADEPEIPPRDLMPAPMSPEAEVLAVLDTLAAGQTVPMSNGGIARADATYDAASGRRCRQVEIGVGGAFETRLACEQKGLWTWFPYVLP
jgi:hypothetical protein